VDNPHDEENAKLVGEISAKVDEIFEVTNRGNALAQLLRKIGEGKLCGQEMFPALMLIRN
jgi:hypothetical protein